MTQEPVALGAAVNAAITATLAILLFVGFDPELVGALTLAATAWVGVVAAVVRSKVTPVERAVVGPDRGSLSIGDIVIVVALAFIVAILVIRFW